ncbi:hypothetical protein ACR6C2_25375 [Streptomyces sp. INA 01156]
MAQRGRCPAHQGAGTGRRGEPVAGLLLGRGLAAGHRSQAADADAEPRMDELRPAGWLPGTMALDPAWHRIDDWLDSDSWYAERGRDETGPAVVQALAILRTQQPGAVAGQRA